MFKNVAELYPLSTQLQQILEFLTQPNQGAEVEFVVPVDQSQQRQQGLDGGMIMPKGYLIIKVTQLSTAGAFQMRSGPRVTSYLTVTHTPTHPNQQMRPSAMINQMGQCQPLHSGMNMIQPQPMLQHAQQIPPLFNYQFDATEGCPVSAGQITDAIIANLLAGQLNFISPALALLLLESAVTGVKISDTEFTFAGKDAEPVVINRSMVASHPQEAIRILAKCFTAVMVAHKENHHVPLNQHFGDLGSASTFTGGY